MVASVFLAAASVASLNLCTDEYLLLLARPQEIASVSFLSHDPKESPLWRVARSHPSNRGSLEQVLSTRPDLVMTMGGGGKATTLIAKRLGLKVLDLPPPASVEDVQQNLVRVASALGDRRRSEPWLLKLRDLQSRAPRRLLDSIFLSGAGESFSVRSPGAQWLSLAGLRQRPLPGGRVSLETLLARPPSVLVVSEYRASQVSRGTAWLNHPIVRRSKSRRVQTDGRAWTCMGPLLIDEVGRLRNRLR